MNAPIALSLLLGHAADVLKAVRGGRSLSEALPAVPAERRPAVQALVFQVLRRLGGALEVRARLVPREPPPNVDALLLTALALLWPEERPPYPDHTLVDQAVQAAHQRLPSAAAFVNAVLRRFVREREVHVAAASQVPQGRFHHPAWWIERVRADWPRVWTALLDEANRHPPLTLRVNARRSTGAAYLQRLAAQGIAASSWPDPRLGGQAVALAQPRPVAQVPGFAEGLVSVQDAAAQLAAPLLIGEGLRPGARVLDACAAPGGKTAHLLELAEPDLLALDIDPARLARVQENLHRLGLRGAQLKSGDARQPAGWWDGRPFDAILLDAPCTASGIVRRHPDVRWLRRSGDIAALAATQAQLLDALWPLLAPGGRLLYATCSIFKAEGQQQIDAFLQRAGAGAARLMPQSPGHWLPVAENGPRAQERALPGVGMPSVAPGTALGLPWTHDGFFYALIEKA